MSKEKQNRVFIYIAGLFLVFMISSRALAIDSLSQKISSLPVSKKIDFLGKIVVYDNVNHTEILELLNNLENDPLVYKESDLLSMTYYYQGVTLRKLKDYDRAIHKFMIALERFKFSNDSNYLCKTYYQLAGVHRIKNHFEYALHYYIESFKISKEIEDTNYLALDAVQIGNIYRQLKLYDSSVLYIKDALNYYRLNKNKIGVANTLHELGQTYRTIGKYDSSLLYFNQALQLRDSIGNPKYVINTLISSVYVYITINDTESALKYALRALKLSEQNNFINGYINANIYLGDIHLMKKLYSKSSNYYNIALANAIKINDKKLISESYLGLYKMYLLTGDYKNALKNYKNYTEYREKLQEDNIKENIAISQGYFDYEKQKLEIEKLTLVQNQQEEYIKKQRRYNYILFAVSILVLLFSILYYMANRQKIRLTTALRDKNKLLEEANNKLLESEKLLKELNTTKDRFFTILAHDLKNPFNVLIGFTELLQSKINDLPREKLLHIFKLMHETSSHGYFLLQNLHEWSKYQSNSAEMLKELFNITELINDNVALIKSAAEQKNIKIELSHTESLMVVADRNMISTAIRNLLSNAIKFTNNGGEVSISVKNNNRYIYVIIKDNGVGMDDEVLTRLFKIDENVSTNGTANEKGTGIGLILTKELIEKNGGKITVTSKINEGSEFQIKLPKPNF